MTLLSNDGSSYKVQEIMDEQSDWMVPGSVGRLAIKLPKESVSFRPSVYEVPFLFH